MMRDLLNQMRFQSAIGQNIISQVRLGLVTSYNPENASVIVQIQPVDLDDPQSSLTGWIPVLTPWIGFNGAPRIGDQVAVAFQEGNLSSGLVIGRVYSSVDVPPNTPSGELTIEHPSGSVVKFTNDGNVTITAANQLIINAQTVNATVPQFNITGNLNVTGDINASGNIADLNGADGDMAHIRSVYDSHTHPIPAGGDTGVPNQPL